MNGKHKNEGPKLNKILMLIKTTNEFQIKYCLT